MLIFFKQTTAHRTLTSIVGWELCKRNRCKTLRRGTAPPEFPVPPGLVRLIAAGASPSGDGPSMKEQQQRPVVPPERVRRFAAEESLICLELPPFRTGQIKIFGIGSAKRLAPAAEALQRMNDSGEHGKYGFAFIDADKPSNADYFAWALKLSRRGSLIVIDNVVRSGAVIDAASDDPDVRGARRLNELLAANPRVSATAIQAVGSKGYDGFAVAPVVAVRGNSQLRGAGWVDAGGTD